MKRIVWVLGILLMLMPAMAFAQKVTLEFVVWNYSLETIQDNIAKFQQANPNIKVNVKDYSWNTYHDVMVLRFKGKTRTDVMYNGEDWLPEFAAAGWVAPLEDYFPAVKAYKAKTAPYALADMTYKGKLYGLSYYADLITFQYNKQMLKGLRRRRAQDLGRCVGGHGEGRQQPGSRSLSPTNMTPRCPTSIPPSSPRSTAVAERCSTRSSTLSSMTRTPRLSSSCSGCRTPRRRGTSRTTTMNPRWPSGMNTGRHVYTVMYNYMLAEMKSGAMRSPASSTWSRCRALATERWASPSSTA